MHNPEGEFVVYGERRVTWGETAVRAKKIAQALIGLGVKKGDKVTFMFHNCPEFLEINFGVQVAGATPVPMNYRFIPREIEFQANHSDASVFIYESRWAENVEKAAPDLKGIKHFVRMGEGGMDAAMDYEEFVSSGAAVDPAVETDWGDPAVMIYTGGTTGFPKGVLLSYGAHLDMFSTLLANIVSRGLQVEMTEQQKRNLNESLESPILKSLLPLLRNGRFKKFIARPWTVKAIRKAARRVFSHPEAARRGYGITLKQMIPSMPLFHDASYQTILLAAMAGNSCYVLIPGVRFEPVKIFQAIETEQPLFMANVPTGWKKLVSHPDKDEYDLSSLRIAATGAGAASVELKKKMFEAFPNAIIADLFGQTEMTPVTSFRIDAGPETLKERSVGKSIVDIKVVDEDGDEVAPGQPGEIMYRSSWVMMGYYKDEDKTGEAMEGGWFKSGDLGYIDEDGEVRLIDRKKECINTGGEKVFPLEVEEVIHLHPKVEDVCIIGVPDEEWGSTVRAVVQLKKDEEAEPAEIMDFCRDKIAGYKIPRSVVFTDELPLSPVGKVLRQKIRELYGGKNI
jgi:acyl-CoA synthetase (AMP-forming)/AMP-acid ligase II